ncbi:response regulator transcription factor [Limibaculum sp. FT325]|uniref:response regulator transcription factor n=1 Tax=Thermohalobaculum sediminis TaxID=2939436 RepID=UPI0020BF6AC0|nr:response regulator transcription factor [Limibaculum sediminis]MCL5776817.1 response regulator transcription factor [Limibaculum sediminis]
MRVLLVEDTPDVADAIVEHFRRRGDAVDLADACAAAADALAVQVYDLLILDINLPDGSGIDILRGLRRDRDGTPVLVLTARLAVEDRVEALDMGADDYLMKPFDLRELEARARALARRRAGESGGVIEYGDLRFDPAGRTAEVAGRPIALTKREFCLLETLVANRGRVMPKEAIFDKLFAFDAEEVGLNAVEVYVGRLRRKLEPSRVAIRTLRGLGYQLVADA